MKFTNAENKVLSETFRRLNYFHNGNLNTNLLLLAMPSEVKTLKEKGILKCSSNEIPKVLNWYNLTEAGKKLFAPYSKRNKLSDKQNHVLFVGERVINFSKK